MRVALLLAPAQPLTSTGSASRRETSALPVWVLGCRWLHVHLSPAQTWHCREALLVSSALQTPQMKMEISGASLGLASTTFTLLIGTPAQAISCFAHWPHALGPHLGLEEHDMAQGHNDAQCLQTLLIPWPSRKPTQPVTSSGSASGRELQLCQG